MNLFSDGIQFLGGDFFSRYLCGGVALREGIRATRLDLSLCQQGFFVNKTLTRLLSDMSCYNKAKQLIFDNNTINESLLISSQALLVAPPLRGLRKVSVRIGGTSEENCSYNTPPHKNIPKLLKNFIVNLNSSERMVAESAYLELLTIHPFRDANGRISRALYEKLKEKKEIIFVHPVLYRLHTDNLVYRICHEEYRRKNRVIVETDIFWKNAIDWSYEVTREIMAKCLAYDTMHNEIVNNNQLSLNELMVLDVLVHYGYASTLTISKLTLLQPENVSKLLRRLFKLKIVQKLDVKVPSNEELFGLAKLVDLWSELDSIILGKYYKDYHET